MLDLYFSLMWIVRPGPFFALPIRHSRSWKSSLLYVKGRGQPFFIDFLSTKRLSLGCAAVKFVFIV